MEHCGVACAGRAIVTDAAERVGLHVIRALGRAGIGVIATEISDRATICPGFSSCYTRESELLPFWERPAEEWVERLLGIGREGDVLVPTCYNSLARSVLHWERLSSAYRALLPSWEALQTANDKWSLYQFAADLEVRTPETWRPQGEAELETLAEQIDYPVILKFRNDDGIFLRPSERYLKADNASTLREAWRLFHGRQPHPIIQQYISGDGYGFEALYDGNREAVVTFQHRRLVECPPEGGLRRCARACGLTSLSNSGGGCLTDWAGEEWRWLSSDDARGQGSSTCWRSTRASGAHCRSLRRPG